MDSTGTVYLTRERMLELEKKLDFLITVRRNQIAEQIAVARGFGDLSENAEYDEAKKEQAAVEAQISELENIKRTAMIIAAAAPGKAFVGTTVRLKDLGTGEEVSYMLVSEEEADFLANKISITSPVGSAFLGKERGARVEIKVPAGTLRNEILEVTR